MKRSLLILSISLLSCGAALQAQMASENAANPLSSGVRRAYENVKTNLLDTAGKVPEQDYGFQPTPQIRTFAQVFNHIASSQMHTCSAILGSKMTYTAPAANASKDNVIAALKASFEECDRAYNQLSDTNATHPVRTYMGEVPQLIALVGNTSHDDHEYGALTVYMRLKGIVPPSTARMMEMREHHRQHHGKKH